MRRAGLLARPTGILKNRMIQIKQIRWFTCRASVADRVFYRYNICKKNQQPKRCVEGDKGKQGRYVVDIEESFYIFRARDFPRLMGPGHVH